MKEHEAINLLEKTFSNNFDLNNFTYFLKELLKNKFNIQNKSPSVASEFEDYIKSFKKIGEYRTKNKDFEILAVELKKADSLERARTMQRNFVAKWLNNSNYPKDGALVAFYGENPEDWRFSFVKMDYKLAEDGKISKELTPAKRHSFLVGKNEPNHTCKRQFLNLLIEEEIPPTTEDLEKAFSVENVTKIFFDKYKELFIKLTDSLENIKNTNLAVKKEFDSKNISIEEFGKKLLGQIVFLYFLQKKGWLGVKKDGNGEFNEWGTGHRDFMKRLFKGEIVKYKNFFNDVLEPLFYEALNTPRDNNYYSRFECKIPFLNGGLFEPINNYRWTETNILIDNNIFSEIFKTFDEFNFTIKEDEPLEREVAIDPEMLGKVFENLLEVKDRKSKGAFYTPREIVHYMCQQSLINYLETNTEISREDLEMFVQKGDLALDYLRRAHEGKYVNTDFLLPPSIYKNVEELNKLLKEIKICDPAVGSGAFPVGMMNEIIKARKILGYFLINLAERKKSDYDLKRETIENCLYGVDLMPSAVDICKLRFWLSLIVDETDMKNIKPLPNLDNKIMCGNSLIEEFEGVKLFNENLILRIDTKKEKQTTLSKKSSEYQLDILQKLQKEFFNEESRDKKNRLREDIDRIEWEFIEATLKEQKNEEAIKRLNEYKSNKSKPFFLWKLYFSDVFNRKNPGFDIVIANPPYVRQEEIKEYKTALENTFTVYTSVADLYTYFYEKGVQVLRSFGTLTFISSNKFMRARYGLYLRRFLKENTCINEIIDFGDKHMFEAITNTAIIMTQKRRQKENKIYFGNSINLKKDTFFEQDNLADSEWTLANKSTIAIKKKMEEKGIPLKNWKFEINYGIKTAFNEAFVIDNETKEALCKEDKKNIAIIKPIIRGRDIGKYFHNWKKLWIINTHNGYSIGQKRVPRINVEKEYPTIYKYFLKINKESGGKIEGREDMGDHWTNLRNCAFLEDFKKEKIIWIELTDENKFSYSDKEEFILAGAFMMVGESLKYLLSFLNCKLCKFYFKLICNSSGMGTLQWKKFAIEKIPVIRLDNTKEEPFIEIVDRIILITDDEDYLKNQEKQAMVKALEKKIDKMVYELYELTPEEIKIVEEFVEK